VTFKIILIAICDYIVDGVGMAPSITLFLQQKKEHHANMVETTCV